MSNKNLMSSKKTGDVLLSYKQSYFPGGIYQLEANNRTTEQN